MNEDVSVGVDDVEALIVDDDACVLEEMIESLDAEGIRARAVSGGHDALEVLRTVRGIRAVVVDLRMPQMDGFALVRAIRDMFADGEAPRIVFVSGHLDTDAAVRAMREDAIDFLAKPIACEDLVVAVQRALSRAREDRDQREAVGSVAGMLTGLKEQVAIVERNLQSLQGDGACGDGDDHAATRHDHSPAVLEARIARLVQYRELRRQQFPDDLFGDPAWDILLDLMRGEVVGYRCYTSGLALEARVPPTTAARYIDSLVDCGLASRYEDPEDRRRAMVAITPKSYRMMADYLASCFAVDVDA